MRDLFKLDVARIWSRMLIIVGVVLLTIAVVLRWNMTHTYPISDAMVFSLTNTAVVIVIGLGITLVTLGIMKIFIAAWQKKFLPKTRFKANE